MSISQNSEPTTTDPLRSPSGLAIRILIFAVVLFLAGWVLRNGMPETAFSFGAAEGEKYFREQIAKRDPPALKLNSYKKIDKISGEEGGVKVSTVSFVAEIEALRPCKWMYHPGGEGSLETSEPVGSGGKGFNWNAFNDATMNPGTMLKNGDRLRLTGSIVSVKTDNGWKVRYLLFENVQTL